MYLDGLVVANELNKVWSVNGSFRNVVIIKHFGTELLKLLFLCVLFLLNIFHHSCTNLLLFNVIFFVNILFAVNVLLSMFGFLLKSNPCL